MKRLLFLGFDRLRVQRYIQERYVQVHSLVLKRSLAQKLTIGHAVLKLTLGLGISVGISIPAGVYAYATQDLLTVYREVGEDYNALTRRAENAARSLAQQRFDSDILQTRVVITVVGENDGQVSPILVLDVKREDWRRRPDPQFWATYYRNTRILLDMDGSGPLRLPQPVAPIAPQPTPLPVAPTDPTVPATPANPSPAPDAPTTRQTTRMQSSPDNSSASASTYSPITRAVNPSPID